MSKFGELIDLQVPVLLDFYAEWNEQSTAMHPVLSDVAAALGDKGKVLRGPPPWGSHTYCSQGEETTIKGTAVGGIFC